MGSERGVNGGLAFPSTRWVVARMVAEGRNPFCALCHDPRGPLSEAARERERARAQFDLSKFENIAGFRNSRSVGINGSTLDEPRVPPTPKSTTLDSHVSGIPTDIENKSLVRIATSQIKAIVGERTTSVKNS